MNINNIIDTTAKLSKRSDLLDSENIGVLLYYINSVKLEIQRKHQFRFNGNSIIFPVVENTVSFDLPTGFLRPNLLYRAQSDTTSNGTSRAQYIHKYTNLIDFRMDFPTLDSNGNSTTGPVEAYILYGPQIVFGPRSSMQEYLHFDHDLKLLDYELNVNEEDILSELGFDYLIRGTLLEIFTSWVPSDKDMAIWAPLKRDSELQLAMLNANEKVTGTGTQRIEVYG